MCFKRKVGRYVIFLKLLKSGWNFYKVGTSGTYKLPSSDILKSYLWKVFSWGLPGGSHGKESACNVGDPCLISGLGISPRGGHGNPFQYSCLENPMDKGAWWAAVLFGCKEADTTNT